MPGDRFAAARCEVDAEFCACLDTAFAQSGPWRQRMRVALAAALHYLAEDPARARLYVADVLVRQGLVRGRRLRGMERLGEMIDVGRLESSRTDGSPRALADGIAGGIWHRVAHRIRGDEAAMLPGELSELMYFVVSPYLGIGAAREELRRLPE